MKKLVALLSLVLIFSLSIAVMAEEVSSLDAYAQAAHQQLIELDPRFENAEVTAEPMIYFCFRNTVIQPNYVDSETGVEYIAFQLEWLQEVAENATEAGSVIYKPGVGYMDVFHQGYQLTIALPEEFDDYTPAQLYDM